MLEVESPWTYPRSGWIKGDGGYLLIDPRPLFCVPMESHALRTEATRLAKTHLRVATLTAPYVNNPGQVAPKLCPTETASSGIAVLFEPSLAGSVWVRILYDSTR